MRTISTSEELDYGVQQLRLLFVGAHKGGMHREIQCSNYRHRRVVQCDQACLYGNHNLEILHAHSCDPWRRNNLIFRQARLHYEEHEQFWEAGGSGALGTEGRYRNGLTARTKAGRKRTKSVDSTEVSMVPISKLEKMVAIQLPLFGNAVGSCGVDNESPTEECSADTIFMGAQLWSARCGLDLQRQPRFEYPRRCRML